MNFTGSAPRNSRATVLAGACMLLSACANLVGEPPSSATSAASEQRCIAALQDVEKVVAAEGISDAQYTRIPGYPHYRVDRFHASFSATVAGTPADSPARREWLQRLAALADEGRTLEIANLDPERRKQLRARLVAEDPANGGGSLEGYLDRCSALLVERDLRGDTVPRIAAAAEVPDAYSTGARAAGLYWLTRWFALGGHSDWKADMRDRFGGGFRESGKRVQLAPAQGPRMTRDEVATIVQASVRASELGIPRPPATDLERLYRNFAPRLELAPATMADMVGTLRWARRAERVETVITAPAAYTMASHTRWQGRNLLQLNYVFWFPRRPTRSMIDPYAGHLDALVWRVTLDHDGSVLFYDSMHACGCYHAIYRVAPHIEVARALPGVEFPFAVEGPVPDAATQRITLRVSPWDHQVIDILAGSGDEDKVSSMETYALRPYNELRALPLPGGGNRSIFGPDGLVPETERGERLYLWPMGVASAGAMRQWGHHAIALTGRRHFDDARLAESLFRKR